MTEDDIIEISKLGEAYWNLGPPLSYLRATGAVAIRWGVFEMSFTNCIRTLSRNPELQELGSKIPGSFNDKAKLFRKLVRLAFADCPTLAQRLCEYATTANQICKKRNAIIHGSWFDWTDFKPEFGITLVTESDGSGDIYSVTLKEIETLSVKISTLHNESLLVLWEPSDLSAKSFGLEPDQLSAWLKHHKDFPAPIQADPILRDPNRKGSLTHPEPFRA